MKANSTLFYTKRNSLQDFVREQLIGPIEEKETGAFEGRFGFDNGDGDIVDATPGTIYCSGILFPRKSSEKDDDSDKETDKSQNSLDNSITDSKLQTADSTSEDELEDDDDVTITQRYPNLFGISCCLGKKQINASDFSIIVSGRHYSKILGNDILHLFVNIPSSYISGVMGLMNTNLSHFFRLDGNKLYLTTSDKQQYSVVADLLDEVDKSIAYNIANNGSQLDPCYSNNPNSNYRIKLSTYRDNVFDSFKREPKNGHPAIIQKMGLIESNEASLHFFRLLLPAIQPHGYGFWRAHYFKKRLNLDGIDFSMHNHKKIVAHKDYPSQLTVIEIPISDDVLKPKPNQQASLSVSLQLLRDNKDSNNNRIYLKAMVENTSSEFVETDKLYYSIATEGVNSRSFFGVRIEVESESLIPYRSLNSSDEVDKETEKLHYLYRRINDWGIGHFCSISWDDKQVIHKVWSEFMPFYDIPDVDTAPQRIVEEEGNLVTEPRLFSPDYLKMYWLSTLSNASDSDIENGLKSFVACYADWIRETIVDSSEPDKAADIKNECEKDCDRMMSNISILSHRKNMEAFRLMNTAMFMQLWQNNSDNQKLVRSTNGAFSVLDESFYRAVGEDIVPGVPICWRPFQLAFIILNIDGIIQGSNDTDWDSRNKVVDLVWFPTGGGKTEAYLGIIALSILHRRLSFNRDANQGDGTTAIMRYTLRLLATQQFQRATRLILALEQIRQWKSYPIGDDNHPISIGLFIGDDSIPNKKNNNDIDSPGLVQEAEKWQNGDKKTKIPFVDHICPWCGSHMVWDTNSQVFRCESAMCAFNAQLPVLLCDEDIFQRVPTLLFGTVDKFAAIARKVSSKSIDDSRRLFKTPDGLTPDLIIQDELHLLQGPLGSADGLFECALDAISTRHQTIGDRTIFIRPKVISSTATTRNTELQIRALYDRSVNVFPKNGINYDDSFFAFYKRNPQNADCYVSKRRYLGILPTGRTEMYMQIRLSSCIFTHRVLFEDQYGSHTDFEDVANYYYSLISYFGSLRDVGSTDAQFVTEFPKYVRQVFHRVVIPHGMMSNLYANNGSLSIAELTGRLDGPGVIAAFGYVEKDWEKDKRLPYFDVGNRTTVPAPTPPDFIMATNMISVGLDVSRFNTMIINSMPRNKAEYIQATSRVARKTPGIVFTIHNPFRARDVSHFEQFREFHEKLYYYVEPISITPFSTKTIQLFMPLFFAAFVRHKFANLAINKDAQQINQTDAKKIKQDVLDYFQNRLLEYKKPSFPTELKGLLTDDSMKEIEQYVDEAISQWLDKKQSSVNGLYYDWDRADSLFVSVDAYEEEKNSSSWVVQSSLRIIPVESVVSIID